MATSGLIRRSGPPAIASVSTSPVSIDPSVGALLDADGVLLTEVSTEGPLRGGRVPLGVVDEPAALLNYYFGLGRRGVLLSLEKVAMEGWLGTAWDGSHRNWWVEVDE